MNKVAPSSGEGEHQEEAHPASEHPARPATAEDRSNVERLLAGDEAAFTSLVDRHHASMVRVALAFVSSRAVAEEVAQDTWAAVLSGLREFEARSSLKTWIFRILTNRAKTRGVREGRTVPFSALDDRSDEYAVPEDRFTAGGHWASPPQPWAVDTPEALVLRSEMLDLVRNAIETLPEGQRAVLVLRDVEGFESEEACNTLGLSETNQRVLLHRARARVRAIIEERLGRS